MTTSLRSNRNFWILLSGQAISFVGNQLQFFAVPLIVLAYTHSTGQAGLVLALGTGAYLSFGLVSGALADRWDRKKTMIWCEVARAVIVGTLSVAIWVDHLTLVQLYLVAITSSAIATLFEAADAASLPNLVTKEQLTPALSYTQTVTNFIRIFGAVIAGTLYGLGHSVPFTINAVSFVLSAMSLRLITVRFSQDREPNPAPQSLLGDIKVGLQWVWRQRAIRALMLITAGDSLRYGAGYLVIIVLAQHRGATPTQIGLLFSGAAVGAMLGAVVAQRAAARFRVGHIAVAMLIVEALMFPLYALAPSVLLLGIVAAAESLVAPIYSVALTAYRMAITPDELRGRSGNALSMVTVGAMSLGALLSGVMISAAGVYGTVWILSGWLAILAVIAFSTRAIREAATDEEPEDVALAEANVVPVSAGSIPVDNDLIPGEHDLMGSHDRLPVDPDRMAAEADRERR